MTLLEQIPTIVAFVTLWVGGLLALWGLFDQKLKARSKERDDQEDRIIDLYKTEVGVLTTKVDGYELEFKSMRAEILRIGVENKLLRDLVTGKDKDTMAWRGRTEDAMKLIEEIGRLSIANGTKMDAAIKMNEITTKNVERLAMAIEKSVGISNTNNRRSRK